MKPPRPVLLARLAHALAGAALACLLVCSGAGIARAQAPADTSTAGGLLGRLSARPDTTMSPADSAAAESLAALSDAVAPEGFHPAWNTHYSLNRQHTDWSQGLIFTIPAGHFLLSHHTTGNITRDTGTRHTRTEHVDIGTGLTFQAAEKLKFRADWILPKDSYSDVNSSNRDNKNNITIGGDYSTEHTGVFDLALSAQGGRAQTDTRQTSLDPDPEHANGPFRVDTPRASGLTGSFHGGGNYYAGSLFKINSKYDYSRERLDNRTRMQWSDSTGTVVESSDSTSTINNHVRNNSVDATLTPWRRALFDVVLSDDSRQDEYYLQNISGQETHTYTHRGITSTNSLTDGPLKGSFTLAYGRLNDGHAHFTSTDVKKTSLRYDAKVDTWKLWGFLLAGELASEKSNEDHPELRPTDVSLDGLHYNNSLDLSLDRSITSTITAHASSNLSLQRDAFTNPRNDRDVTARRVAFSTAWTATKKITLGSGFEANQRNDVSISNRRSANNTSKTAYVMSPNYTYKITPNTAVSQSVLITSDFTIYTFLENRNYYTGTTTISTNLTSQLTPRVKLDMTHMALLRLQGSYAPTVVSLEPYLLERRFGQTNEDKSQEMRVSLRYTIGNLDFTLAQRVAFLNRYVKCKIEYGKFFCEPDRKGSTRQLSLTPALAVNYTLRMGAKLTVNVTRYEVSGAREQPYWRIDSSLSKVFFR